LIGRVAVFCGSSAGNRPAYAEAARALGRALAGRGIGLVYGGGRVGLMGVVADTVLQAGGEAIGVIPEPLLRREVGHVGLSELVVVDSMHARKARMADLSDAFVALPGGFGTLEELLEVITWSQLGIHPKACALLDVAGFFDPLLRMFDHAVEEGFVRPAHRSLVVVERDPERLLDRLAAFRAPPAEPWIVPQQR
jgi:uncharacterized protein (TIGR00730 family)